MEQPISTKDKLLQAARNLFWTRGYSNVSVRDIAGAAGVDAALISRHFAGKQGLFEATLAEIPPWEALTVDREALLDKVVEHFALPYDPVADATNAFNMLLCNIIDPEMGARTREFLKQGLAAPLAERIGGAAAKERAAMLLAVLFGVALMRKNFQLQGIADKTPEDVASQIRHLAQAALDFES